MITCENLLKGDRAVQWSELSAISKKTARSPSGSRRFSVELACSLSGFLQVRPMFLSTCSPGG